MSRGESGRIVIEVDPGMKRRLYAALALSGSTLKDWFLHRSLEFIGEKTQEGLPRVSYPPSRSSREIMVAAEEPPKYKTKEPLKTKA
jgi:hypothetical protein